MEFVIAIVYPMTKFILMLALVLGGTAPSDYGGASLTFRDIRVHVIDIHGNPAAKRKIDLVGLERWSMEPSADNAAKFWHFVTDEDGNIVVPIGNFAGWEGNEVRPGWGVYALIVHPGSYDAGGVSSRFWFDNAPSHNYDPATVGWAPEWGAILPVPESGFDVKITIQKGFALKGRVVDDQHPEIPLAGVELRTTNDLRANTHTGVGGEILGGYAKTDAHGNFTIPRQFPNMLYVDIQPTIWLKTRVDGKWEDQVTSLIHPPPTGNAVKLEIGATQTPRFKYFGRVHDAAGQPVANSQVNVTFMSHSETASATWEEEHSSHTTSTRIDGTYEFVSPTPWVIGIEAEMSGHKPAYFQKSSDNQILTPGEYDLTFSK